MRQVGMVGRVEENVEAGLKAILPEMEHQIRAVKPSPSLETHL